MQEQIEETKMPEIKHFNIRIPTEMWKFLKTTAIEENTSMMDIIMSCLTKYKKSYMKKNVENTRHDYDAYV